MSTSPVAVSGYGHPVDLDGHGAIGALVVVGVGVGVGDAPVSREGGQGRTIGGGDGTTSNPVSQGVLALGGRGKRPGRERGRAVGTREHHRRIETEVEFLLRHGVVEEGFVAE